MEGSRALRPVEGVGGAAATVASRMFEVDDLALTVVTPVSADALLDQMEDDGELPFWAHLWDSAYGLTRFLMRCMKTSAPEGRRLLEIGCGVGAVGCAAAALGWDVVMTDYQPDALRFAARNIEENNLNAHLVLADWRRFPITGPFDLVVGSDVLYESTLHDCLTAILSDLRSSGAAVALADPGRPTALNFAAKREKEGWPVALELVDGQDGQVAVYHVPPHP
jgi:EEF1A lysine methyltransferase 3